MKRLIIIVEGQTEEEFVKEVLRPYFSRQGIYSVTPIKIATSAIQKGGFVNYAHLKNDAVHYLHESGIVVSMFVDFFRVPTSLPGYANCMAANASTDAKIECLEQSIAADINHPNFIPYIQKHEFESLLFSSNLGFEQLFSTKTSQRTKAIIDENPNPEEINSDPESSPANRLLRIFYANEKRKYNKAAFGNLVALEIGVETIIEKCERFRNWIATLTRQMQEG